MTFKAHFCSTGCVPRTDAPHESISLWASTYPGSGGGWLYVPYRFKTLKQITHEIAKALLELTDLQCNVVYQGNKQACIIINSERLLIMSVLLQSYKHVS